MSMHFECPRSNKLNIEHVVSFIKGLRVKKPAIVFRGRLDNSVLLPASYELGKTLLASYVKDKQGADLGTVVFAYSIGQACSTKHLFTEEGERVFSTKASLLSSALLGHFEFDSKSQEKNSRFKSLRFSALEAYLPEESAGAFLEYFLREQGYLDILALPLIAVQERILRQARANLHKEYMKQKTASLDPVRADRKKIENEYLKILYRQAQDFKKLLVVTQNEARWLNFSLPPLKDAGLLSVFESPYDNSVRQQLLKSPDKLSQTIKKILDKKVFGCSDNLINKSSRKSCTLRTTPSAVQLDLFK